MAVYWPLALFAAAKAVRQVCETFYRERDATKLREFCFDEGVLNSLLPYERFYDNIAKYRVAEALAKRK